MLMKRVINIDSEYSAHYKSELQRVPMASSVGAEDE